MAKSFFAEHGINIRVKSIENKEVKEEMRKRFNRVMVPTIIIRGKTFIGFDANKPQIKEMLKV